MQTFLPYPCFVESAACLDSKRLQNQLNEAKIILASIETGKGWIYHPATHMWRGYEECLKLYHNVLLHEWIKRRGYGGKHKYLKLDLDKARIYPRWLGVEKFHASHRSNLIRKMPEHYDSFNWSEGPNLEYFWPTKEGYDEHIAKTKK